MSESTYRSKDQQVSLFLGDCLDIMPEMSSSFVDLVICDPPYGKTSMKWDSIIPFAPFWEQLSRVCSGSIVLFSAQPFTTDLIVSNKRNYKYSLVWKKNVPTGMAQAKTRPMRYHEDISIFYSGKYNPQPKERIGDNKQCYAYNHYCGSNNHISLKKIPKKYDPEYVLPSSVLEFDVVPNRSGKLHPTQKPVKLCEYLIKTYSDVGDVVLDSCFGSGTTAIACLNTGRRFVGIERDFKYFNTAIERIENWYLCKI